MRDFFILRHGETTWNRDGRLQGHLDSPLTERGRRQAARQGDILRTHGAQACPVVSSPSGRAMATAKLALPGCAPVREPRLKEVGLGAWQGRRVDEVAEHWPWAMEDPDPFWWKFAAPGGESLEALTARLQNWLGEQSGSAIVVTHGVTSQVLRGILRGLDLQAMAELEDEQGVVYHVSAGQERRLAAA